MRRWKWNPQRDNNYYFGLFLLVVASASLVWAIWRDAFEPRHFLVYFLIYAWGYVLLFKSDTEDRLQKLEKKVAMVISRLEALEESGENKQEPPVQSGELFSGAGGDFTGPGMED